MKMSWRVDMLAIEQLKVFHLVSSHELTDLTNIPLGG